MRENNFLVSGGSMEGTSPNTAYTLRAKTLALRDIAPCGRNVVYAGTVICHCPNK